MTSRYRIDRKAEWEAFMLDVAGIIISSVLMLAMIVRAIRMDRLQPWFQTHKHEQPTTANDRHVWQRQRQVPSGR